MSAIARGRSKDVIWCARALGTALEEAGGGDEEQHAIAQAFTQSTAVEDMGKVCCHARAYLPMTHGARIPTAPLRRKPLQPPLVSLFAYRRTDPSVFARRCSSYVSA